MKRASGSGRVHSDLGLVDRLDEEIQGEIGGAGQPSTLLVLFRTSAPFELRLVRQPIQPFTDRFLAVGLRHRDGDAIALGDQGEPVQLEDAASGRLPPGEYAVSIATSQWQRAPFRLRLAITAASSLRLALAGRGELLGGFQITRLQATCSGRGHLGLEPSRLRALRVRSTQYGQLGSALVSIPTYQSSPGPGLPHAWRLENGSTLQIGSGDGSAWTTTQLPVIENYAASSLSVADYRTGSQRLIFAQGAEDVYATYTEIGPTPAHVTQPVSPDVPGRSFMSVIQGTHVRRCTFSLPVDGATQLLVVLREELKWNNDVIRDLDITNALAAGYSAVNARATSAHQRTIRLFVVTATAVRQLRQLPSVFCTSLDHVLPPLNSFLRARALRVPGDQYPKATVTCVVPDFALTGGAPSEGDRIFGADPSEPYGNLLISYGLTWSMQARQGLTSAAIYDLLRDYDAIRSQADYDRRSYSFVLRNLANRPAGLPQYSPWVEDGGYAGASDAGDAYGRGGTISLLYGQWSGPFPADASTSLPMTGSQWARTNYGLTLSADRLALNSAPTLSLSYDWHQPEYCRSSLGSLGFSSGDLQVTVSGGRGIVALSLVGVTPLRGSGSLERGQAVSVQVRLLSMALRSQGSLAASKVLLGNLISLRGRGRMALSLATGPGVVPVILGALLRGSGRLVGASLIAQPSVSLRGAGSLGRPVIFAYPLRLLRTSQTGQGSLAAPFLSSSATRILASPLTGRGGLGLTSLSTTPTGATPPDTGRLSLGLLPIDRLFLFDPDD